MMAKQDAHEGIPPSWAGPGQWWVQGSFVERGLLAAKQHQNFSSSYIVPSVKGLFRTFGALAGGLRREHSNPG